MYASPTQDRRKAATRMIATSFVAGAGLMLLAALVLPLTQMGVLAVQGAEASPREVSVQLIEPLDLPSIEAQLAVADQSMRAARAQTDDDIARLARLTPR